MVEIPFLMLPHSTNLQHICTYALIGSHRQMRWLEFTVYVWRGFASGQRQRVRHVQYSTGQEDKTTIHWGNPICDGWCHRLSIGSPHRSDVGRCSRHGAAFGRLWPGSSTQFTTTSRWPCCDERLPSATNRCCCCHGKAARSSGPSGPRRKDLGRTGWGNQGLIIRWSDVTHGDHDRPCTKSYKHKRHKHPKCQKSVVISHKTCRSMHRKMRIRLGSCRSPVHRWYVLWAAGVQAPRRSPPRTKRIATWSKTPSISSTLKINSFALAWKAGLGRSRMMLDWCGFVIFIMFDLFSTWVVNVQMVFDMQPSPTRWVFLNLPPPGDSQIGNRVLEALFRRIVKAHEQRDGRFHVVIVLPLLPALEGPLCQANAGLPTDICFRKLCTKRIVWFVWCLWWSFLDLSWFALKQMLLQVVNLFCFQMEIHAFSILESLLLLFSAIFKGITSRLAMTSVMSQFPCFRHLAPGQSFGWCTLSTAPWEVYGRSCVPGISMRPSTSPFLALGSSLSSQPQK